jgi:quercetin dioxygenase-like cupin family protein
VHAIATTEALWFLDTLTIVRHATAGDAPFSLLDTTARPGNASPLHRHLDEDEVFTVLEGELTLTVGDETIVVGPGRSAVGPRGVPHRYEVTSTDDARWLVLTTPGGFEAFVRELSEPAEDVALPPAPTGPPSPEQIEALAATAARHGIEIIG